MSNQAPRTKHTPASSARHPDKDAKLVALGKKLEPLIIEAFDCFPVWAVGLCAAHRETRKRFGKYWYMSPRKVLAQRAFNRITKKNGTDAADKPDEQIHLLLEQIKELSAHTVAGLRPKALSMFWTARPIVADKPDGWDWPDDYGATYSLFRDVAEMTGLTAMIDHYEAKFAQAAEEIKQAGGDGFADYNGGPDAAREAEMVEKGHFIP